MMGEKFYKRMFLIAAIMNVAGGVVIVALTGWIFSIANLNPPDPPAYYYSWIALFVAFGIGYYMVYRNMYENKNIVILGTIGKLTFSVIFICNMIFSWGQIPWLFIVPVVNDLIFVILFWAFLSHARKIEK
ncbi:hypothetical protein ACFL6S_33025 [Candidatus Poribacteria bacterium]